MQKTINNIIGYIDSNLTDRVSVDNIAGKFCFNRRYIQHCFKKNTGLTITQYTNYKKIINSFSSLVSTDDKILKVALNNGFNSLEYYSETFCKIVGISPMQFRKYGKEILESIAVQEGDGTKIGEARKFNEIIEQIKAFVYEQVVEIPNGIRHDQVKDKPKVKVKVRVQDKRNN